MSSDFDATDFVDSDFQAPNKASASQAASMAATTGRAPTREEVDSKVGETQQKLAELKRIQEELERERAALEETRRRQIEYQTGRQEMLQNLTRGVGLLEEAEFSARRDAEQMAKSLTDMREALVKVEALHEEGWNKENFSIELTRALTTIENARMEWNAARLKFSVLSGKSPETEDQSANRKNPLRAMAELSFGELCKLGLALTWPVALAALAGVIILGAMLMRH
ncbi:MAG: hypothetical protein JWQ71_4404 [Pedosphaera sp.]|nr:hypothetical protein [Pedosphaera sp.]